MNKDYEEGYNDGRTYYINDISKQIYDVKCSIRTIEAYCENYTGDVLEELERTLIVLEAVLRKAKKGIDKK